MSKKLYVGNLPYTCSDEDLANIFAELGTVTSSRIIIDRDSGRSKGFGFVEMASDEEAVNAATQLNGQPLMGRPLTVNEARPRENDGRGMGRGGYEGVRM